MVEKLGGDIYHVLTQGSAHETRVCGFAGSHLPIDEMAGFHWAWRCFIDEMFLQGSQGVRACRTVEPDFMDKGGDGGSSASTIMAKCVQDIQGVFRLLPAAEGAELEGEKGSDFTDACGEFLIGSV